VVRGFALREPFLESERHIRATHIPVCHPKARLRACNITARFGADADASNQS